MGYDEVSRRAVKEIGEFQGKVEESLSRELGVRNIREELISGFLGTRKLSAARQKQIALYIRLMAMAEQASGMLALEGQENPGLIHMMRQEAEKIWSDIQELSKQEG